MYQNWLGPSSGIYYPNFVPCFVVLYLNSKLIPNFCGPFKKLTFKKLYISQIKEIMLCIFTGATGSHNIGFDSGYWPESTKAHCCFFLVLND